MLKIYLAIVRASWQTYGLKWPFWQWSLLMPCFLGFTHFTLWLDQFFFPQYPQTALEEPIFIIGNPRSGTSFLHRQLTQTQDFAAFETWQLIFPALTARVLFQPLIRYLIKTGRSTLLPAHLGHELSLSKVEHDEFLFFYNLDTQFVTVLTPLAYDDQEYPELRFHDQQHADRRLSSVQFLKGCLQRQLYITGRQRVIAHLHFSVNRVKSLLDVFPDAKFIYMVRSPHETIPSHLSLNYNTLHHTKSAETVSRDKLNRFFQRRYRYDIELYQYFNHLQENKDISPQNTVVIEYSQLLASLSTFLDKLFDYLGIQPSHQLKQAIQSSEARQKQYTRKHKIIPLEQFNLTHQQISKDLDFIISQYNLGFDSEYGLQSIEAR